MNKDTIGKIILFSVCLLLIGYVYIPDILARKGGYVFVKANVCKKKCIKGGCYYPLQFQLNHQLYTTDNGIDLGSVMGQKVNQGDELIIKVYKENMLFSYDVFFQEDVDYSSLTQPQNGWGEFPLTD